jgi:hypothetical protein
MGTTQSNGCVLDATSCDNFVSYLPQVGGFLRK